MDYIKEAKKLGFSNAAIMDTQKLVFKPEYRKSAFAMLHSRIEKCSGGKFSQFPLSPNCETAST